MLKWLYTRPYSEIWAIPRLRSTPTSIAELKVLSDVQLLRIEKVYKALRKRHKESLASKRSKSEN